MGLRSTSNVGQLGEVELKLFSDGQSVDWYLQRLVAIANSSDLEVGITLVVGGSVVSGRLIGGGSTSRSSPRVLRRLAGRGQGENS